MFTTTLQTGGSSSCLYFLLLLSPVLAVRSRRTQSKLRWASTALSCWRWTRRLPPATSTRTPPACAIRRCARCHLARYPIFYPVLITRILYPDQQYDQPEMKCWFNTCALTLSTALRVLAADVCKRLTLTAEPSGDTSRGAWSQCALANVKTLAAETPITGGSETKSLPAATLANGGLYGRRRRSLRATLGF
jgi:hypothetical protein